jgi:hypothetical protein
MDDALRDTVSTEDGRPHLLSADAARHHIGALARLAVLGSEHDRALARFAIRAAARDLGAYPASIAALYQARGRGEVSGFTVPAVNVRGMTYAACRAYFRAMRETSCPLSVFEINRAEVAFTRQSPAEFSACVMAAAIAECWEGPVFIQGDHIQFSPSAYALDPEAEILAVEALIRDMVAAGFYNVDIDASTLVDLTKPTVAQQQATNAALTARLVRLVRSIEPPGVRISVGGEIGEVGAHNSTLAELRAYADQVCAQAGEPRPLSKVSVQTGTTHGGLPLPGGGVAEVALDFAALRDLGAVARAEYGMAGCVQHGASTLPEQLFSLFPNSETAEVHLATGFQDVVLDHPAFPAELRERMHAWCLANLAAERTPGHDDAQFIYRARRKAWGPFKRECLELGQGELEAIMAALQVRLATTIRSLGAANTRDLTSRYIRPSTVAPTRAPD